MKKLLHIGILAILFGVALIALYLIFPYDHPFASFSVGAIGTFSIIHGVEFLFILP
ncbi:hypothetical protein ACFL2U_00620 [Patescibacteria group bacterium]